MATPGPPPGWYPDPTGSGGQSYWNGTAWGEPPTEPKKKSHKIRNGVLIAVGALVALVIVGNLLPKPEQRASDQPSSSETATTAASSTAPTTPPNRPAGYVSRETWTDGPWPLTVDEAVLECQGDGLVTIAAGGSKYALNAAAVAQTELPDYADAIGVRDPGKPGHHQNARPLIEKGLALCGITASPTTPSGGMNRPAGQVKRETWTDGRWPFTVDSATLLCERNSAGYEQVLVVANDEMYALNGTAKDANLWPPFNPIWRDDPKAPGLKVNIGPMIDRGLALCQG